MQSVILTELGISIFEDKKCVKQFPFSNPVKDYLSVKKAEANLSKLANHLSNQAGMIEVNDEALMNILKKKSIDVQMLSEQEIEEISSSKPDILVESDFAKDKNDAMSKLRNFAIDLSSSKVTEISSSPDLHIIQGINTLDEVDKIINGISSRLREWYGLHFPELDNIVDSIIGYSQVVLAGQRDEMTEKVFSDAGFPESKVEMLSLIREKSRGGEISKENLSIVQTLAKQILELHDMRKKLEEHVETQMHSLAPNLSAILGTSVGARILARAGSLKNLAGMPASTIQVLGAEKALFRSLKTGSQPPKHGLLFQHSLVHAAPRWQRGKLARAIAAKAAIATRVDVYGGGLNETLLEKLNIRVKEIGEKNRFPTEKKTRHEESFKRNERGSARGDRGSARGDRGSARGDRGSARGDRGSARGDRGSARGDRGSARGDRGSARGDRGSARGDRGSARGDRGSARGDRGSARGDRGSARGDRGSARGDRGSARGDRGSARGDRGSARGDRGSARGDRGSARGDRSKQVKPKKRKKFGRR